MDDTGLKKICPLFSACLWMWRDFFEYYDETSVCIMRGNVFNNLTTVSLVRYRATKEGCKKYLVTARKMSVLS
jgi:hypothetical protein